jgi:hypothetical protein
MYGGAVSSSLLRFVLFLAAAGGLTVVINLMLPAIFYNVRVKGRRTWAVANGFTPCIETERVLTASASDLAAAFPRGGKVLSCLARGPLRVTDMRHKQTLGGLSAGGAGANRALTLVEVSLGKQVPDIVLWPRPRGAGGLLLGGLARTPGVRGSAIGSLFASVGTGDARFDESFQIMAPDEESAREFLQEPLRRAMLEAGRLTFLFAGREALLHGRGLASTNQLNRLVATAERIHAVLTPDPEKRL